MQYRRFGRTELQMPVFSCGGMRYQQSWDDMPLEEVEAANQQNLAATIARGVEVGIHHIETARGYGSSERQLGVVLPIYPRDKLIVQTKIAPTADSALFEQHFNESLERLRLEHVDLLGIHGINTFELLWHATRPGGCLHVARRLQAEGKVRHVGFSTHGSLPLILAALGHDADGGFDYVNLHWYYILQHNWPAIELARQRDMGVFIISPNDKGGMLYKPSERLVELCEPLHPIVFNSLFCLSRPEVHTLSVGAAQPSDFDLQLTALDALPDVAELLPPIVARLEAAMAERLGTDVARHYAEGLPEWEDAPGYINMRAILWLRNLAIAYDLVEYGKMRYNLLGNGGHWFAGLNAGHLSTISDERFDTAVKASPFAPQIRAWLREADDMLRGTEVKRASEGD